ncbi:MAG: hypothetical protein EZS28_016165, partial [Streblomastix strix]
MQTNKDVVMKTDTNKELNIKIMETLNLMGLDNFTQPNLNKNIEMKILINPKFQLSLITKSLDLGSIKGIFVKPKKIQRSINNDTRSNLNQMTTIKCESTKANKAARLHVGEAVVYVIDDREISIPAAIYS